MIRCRESLAVKPCHTTNIPADQHVNWVLINSLGKVHASGMSILSKGQTFENIDIRRLESGLYQFVTNIGLTKTLVVAGR